VDVSLCFSPHVGVGAILRYATASINMPSGSGGTMRVDAGGLHTGAGVRFRF